MPPESLPAIGIRLEMPAHWYRPGDLCWRKADISNSSASAETALPIVVLDMHGEYYLLDDRTIAYLVAGEDASGISPQDMFVIDPFIWPDTGDESIAGILFWVILFKADAAMTIGSYDIREFGYGPE